MLYELYIERHAEKDLKTLADSPQLSEIIKKIKALKNNPHPQGSKKIKGSHNDWRLRIGNYRVLYEINKTKRAITIMKVKHRRDVYRDF
jgi:mRNA interferase RelE/StbE